MILETICMKCQNLFSGKNKINIINLSSAEFAKSVVKVKQSSKRQEDGYRQSIVNRFELYSGNENMHYPKIL